MEAHDAGTGRGRRERWWRSVFLIVATVYVSLLLAALLFQILGGFTQIALIVFMAWLLAFVLSPVVAWMTEHLGLRRGAAIGVAYGLTLVGSGFLLFYAVSAVASSMGQMANEFPLTRVRIEATLRGWEEAVSFARLDLNLVALYRDIEATAVQVAGSALGEVPSVTVAVLGALVLVVILSLYMLADSEAILAKLYRVVPTRYADEVEILERSVSNAFGGFLRAQVILAAVQAGLTVVVVLLVGLPYAFLIVAVSALAMLIPFFGPPLALLPPVLATAVFSPGWFVVVAPALVVAQTVLVNYLQPRLLREALGVHPIVVLVGLLVGAQVAGLWGALFGIPILAVLNVFFNYAINLRTIDETPSVEVAQVLEEVRREEPEATHEEVVAIAADRVEDSIAGDEAEGEEPSAATEADVREVVRRVRDEGGSG